MIQSLTPYAATLADDEPARSAKGSALFPPPEGKSLWKRLWAK